MILPENGWSIHLDRFPDQRPDKRRKGRVRGLCLHTSGRGILKKAVGGKTPDQAALEYYAKAKYSTHYVLGLERTWQLTNDHERISHVGYLRPGMTAAAVKKWYSSGAWEKELPKAFVARWHAMFPEHASPAHLIPEGYQTPSDAFVAAELIPCTGFAEPIRPGYLYTASQHVQAAFLAVDLAARHGWERGWLTSGCVATHEALAPHDRAKAGQGWDPGILREKPWFDWEFFKAQVRLFQGIYAVAGWS